MSASQVPADVWASGAAYEPYVGRWSRRVAREFVRWLAIAANLEWLDIGSGTGALSRTILDHAQPSRVRGVDPSEGFVAFARANIDDARATFAVGDARALPAQSGEFDAAVSGLVLNFVPLPEHVLFGMLTFGIGHGCYIKAFSDRGRTAGIAPPYARGSAFGVAWLIALLGCLGLVRTPKISAALNYGARAYALLLPSKSCAAKDSLSIRPARLTATCSKPSKRWG